MAVAGLFDEFGGAGAGNGEEKAQVAAGFTIWSSGERTTRSRSGPVGGAGTDGVGGGEERAVDVAVDVFVGAVGGAGVGIAQIGGQAGLDDAGEQQRPAEEVGPLPGGQEGAADVGGSIRGRARTRPVTALAGRRAVSNASAPPRE